MADRTSSGRVERLLTQPEIHEKWIADYRSADNQAYFELAFDVLRPWLCEPAG